MEAASPPTIKIQKPKLHDRSLYGFRGWTASVGIFVRDSVSAALDTATALIFRTPRRPSGPPAAPFTLRWGSSGRSPRCSGVRRQSAREARDGNALEAGRYISPPGPPTAVAGY